MTFIEIARTSNPEKSARCRGHARRALAEIQRGLMEPASHGLSKNHIVFLEQRLIEIEFALSGF